MSVRIRPDAAYPRLLIAAAGWVTGPVLKDDAPLVPDRQDRVGVEVESVTGMQVVGRAGPAHPVDGNEIGEVDAEALGDESPPSPADDSW
ncbi:hypothetical protein [Georgenia sp. SUBG003]|uniref:hypothetical protein n=1 Tax=Georgenia sp. SUBG003 TaxID=1497974 RepID=UPI003AB761B1